MTMKAAKAATVTRPLSRIHSGSSRLISTVRSTLEPRGGYTPLQQTRIQKVDRYGRLRRPTFKQVVPPPATARSRVKLERETGFEPATSTLARSRSTK